MRRRRACADAISRDLGAVSVFSFLQASLSLGYAHYKKIPKQNVTRSWGRLPEEGFNLTDDAMMRCDDAYSCTTIAREKAKQSNPLARLTHPRLLSPFLS